MKEIEKLEEHLEHVVAQMDRVGLMIFVILDGLLGLGIIFFGFVKKS